MFQARSVRGGVWPPGQPRSPRDWGQPPMTHILTCRVLGRWPCALSLAGRATGDAEPTRRADLPGSPAGGRWCTRCRRGWGLGPLSGWSKTHYVRRTRLFLSWMSRPSLFGVSVALALTGEERLLASTCSDPPVQNVLPQFSGSNLFLSGHAWDFRGIQFSSASF